MATSTVTPTPIVQSVTPTPTRTASPSSREDEEDDPRRLTDEQRQHRERTNASNLDDYRTEGNVIAVERDGETMIVFVALRDGIQQVVLSCSVGAACPDVRVGDYVEAEGVKEHEGLFYADEITVTRDGRRVRR